MRTAIILLVFLLIPAVVSGEPLRLAFDPYPPFEYKEDGQLKGTSIDLVNKVCRRIGLEPEYIETPFARALYDVENGAVDGLFSLFITPERAKFINYATEPLGHTVTAVVTRGNSIVEWDGLQSLYDYHVGRVRGYSHGKEVDAMEGVHFTEVKDTVFLLRMLDSGRIDIAVCNLDVLSYLHAREGMKWRIHVLKELVRKPLYIGFSRALGERGRKLAEDFSREIGSLRGGQ